MGLFKAGTTSLHYLIRGSGEPVVLIHGMGSSGADWAFQVPALEPRFRVIVPDLPGSGYSAPPGDGYSIRGFAASLWQLLDHLNVGRANLVGFSLGGAVALEMALQRPAAVPRLALINSLATYRLNHWKKWLEARVPPLLVYTLGMRRTARLVAARVFPEPWQAAMRERAVAVVGQSLRASYLGMARALEHWSATERLHLLRARSLVIAAEYDYTPLAEKHALAQRIGAEIVVARGSRHGTPFDSIELTNASLLALLMDEPLPGAERWVRDAPERAPRLPPLGSIAEEHAAGPTDAAARGSSAN
jgi:pimeloyl-ACP methyl ester carboxylesterase